MRVSRILATMFALGSSIAHMNAKADCGFEEPCSRKSTVPPVIVGSSTGAPQLAFTIQVRDSVSNPWTDGKIWLTFSNTAIGLYASQLSDPAPVCETINKWLTKPIGPDGSVTFHPRFVGFDNVGLINVSVETSDGRFFNLGNIRGRSTDILVCQGCPAQSVELADFVYFSDKFLHAPWALETDFNLNGTTDIGDLALFSADMLSGSSSPLCVPE